MFLQRHGKSVLFALTLAYAGLMFVGGSNVTMSFRVPHDPAAGVAFVAQYSWPIRWGSFCEFVSAIPLGIFMAISVSRLRSAGIRSPAAQIASLGLSGTPLMLIGSALATWSLTRPGVAAAPGAVQTLQALGFDGGGPGFAVFFGLFVAGVCVAAGVEKRLPWWQMWLGIVVAAAGELSSLTLLNFTAGYFIPVARMLGIVWMLGLALTLPTAVSFKEDEHAALVAEAGY
jgi:hypothetical protein